MKNQNRVKMDQIRVKNKKNTIKSLKSKIYNLLSNNCRLLYHSENVTFTTKTMGIMFLKFWLLHQIFFSPQVKQSVKISNKHGT